MTVTAAAFTPAPDAAWLRGQTNLAEIGMAFGEHAAAQARRSMRRRLEALSGTQAHVIGEAVWLSVPAPGPAGWQAADDEWLLALEEAACGGPVAIDGGDVFLRLSWDSEPQPDLPDRVDWPPAVGAADAWLPGYRADMVRTQRLFQDLDDGVLVLAFQPVASRDGARVLYHEALLRRWQRAGEPVSGGEAVAAAERVGLVARLDRAVIDTVWGLLSGHPELSLGCNVSAVTLEDAAWWRCFERRLAGAPDVARRLTLEITETRAITRLASAVALTRRLRALGCRVALDDMGGGHSSTEVLVQLRPDIVKIDRAILMQSCDARCPARTLHALVELCCAYADTVIVEGVESAAMLAVAVQAGVHGYQGYFRARPAILQPGWAGSPVRVRRSALQDARLVPA